MATLAIVLNTTYKITNGGYAVALRVTHERKPKYFAINTLIINGNLSFQCTPIFWKPAGAEDNGLGRFRKTFTNFKEYNITLETKLKDGDSVELDHLIPGQADHQFRGKLTRGFRDKLTTLNV
jgi:integrase/recombinase XerD